MQLAADAQTLFAVNRDALDYASYDRLLAETTAESVLKNASTPFPTDGFVLPSTDLKVIAAERRHETVEPYTVPKDAEATTPAHVHYCVRQFNAERVLVLAAADTPGAPPPTPKPASLQAHDTASDCSRIRRRP